MAKDGTNRGGRRIRSGEKPQPLADKIANKKDANVLEISNLEANEISGENMPNPSNYLIAKKA